MLLVRHHPRVLVLLCVGDRGLRMVVMRSAPLVFQDNTLFAGSAVDVLGKYEQRFRREAYAWIKGAGLEATVSDCITDLYLFAGFLDKWGLGVPVGFKGTVEDDIVDDMFGDLFGGTSVGDTVVDRDTVFGRYLGGVLRAGISRAVKDPGGVAWLDFYRLEGCVDPDDFRSLASPVVMESLSETAVDMVHVDASMRVLGRGALFKDYWSLLDSLGVVEVQESVSS